MILTAQEYESLPEDNRMELVDVIVRMGPTPIRRHQVVAENLRTALKVVCWSREHHQHYPGGLAAAGEH